MLLAAAGLVATAHAAPVVFTSAVATQAASPEGLNMTINGLESDPEGWCVPGNAQAKQAAVFTASSPLEASLFQVKLTFLTSAIAEFALFTTYDPVPSLDGNWEPVQILEFRAEGATLSETRNHRLRADEAETKIASGNDRELAYFLTVLTPVRLVTGFRLETYPVFRSSGDPRPRMSWGRYGEFHLTEFRVEPVPSTNVALGATAHASHPLWSNLHAHNLTDGMPSTIAHPAPPGGLGASFRFDIDLGENHTIDHIGLRARNTYSQDSLNRFTRILVQLYDRYPEEGVPPAWQGLDRADGSLPTKGATVDQLRAADGKGTFRGRFIRISSDNPDPLSPQLAEVEVYETRTPQLTSVRSDLDEELLAPETPSGKPNAAASIKLPASVRFLTLQMRIPQFGAPPGPLFRWRLRGHDDTWHEADSLRLQMPAPRPGDYVFEAQAGHSDGTWDSSILSCPMRVEKPFVQTITFRALAASLLLGAILSAVLIRRRILAFKMRTVLAAERTRIARDMHDEIGSKLARLSVIGEIAIGGLPANTEVKSHVEEMARGVREAAGELEHIIWSVDPRHDTLDGVAHRIFQYAEEFFSGTPVQCQFEPLPALPHKTIRPQERAAMLGAVKEALANVLKHSGASTVLISLRLHGRRLDVRIADSGRGFDRGVLSQDHGGNGLGNMAARMKKLGGECTIDASPGRGTTVTLCWPLDKAVGKSE